MRRVAVRPGMASAWPVALDDESSALISDLPKVAATPPARSPAYACLLYFDPLLAAPFVHLRWVSEWDRIVVLLVKQSHSYCQLRHSDAPVNEHLNYAIHHLPPKG